MYVHYLLLTYVKPPHAQQVETLEKSPEVIKNEDIGAQFSHIQKWGAAAAAISILGIQDGSSREALHC